jgi:PHD/YefM family antitoxin component YafN of YafNO toxin-antitoxin module
MVFLPDVYALTEFREHAAQHVRRLRKSKKATLLTQKGRAAAVIMSPEVYEEMAGALELARSIESVKQSMKEFDQGKGRPAEEVLASIRARYTRRASGRAR